MKTFVAPITIPFQSKMMKVYYKWYNFVDSPGNMYIRIYRNHFATSHTEKVFEWEVRANGAGFKSDSQALNEHMFNSTIWAYWAEVILPPGNHVSICHFQIYFHEPIANPFGVAAPFIRR